MLLRRAVANRPCLPRNPQFTRRLAKTSGQLELERRLLKESARRKDELAARQARAQLAQESVKNRERTLKSQQDALMGWTGVPMHERCPKGGRHDWGEESCRRCGASVMTLPHNHPIRLSYQQRLEVERRWKGIAADQRCKKGGRHQWKFDGWEHIERVERFVGPTSEARWLCVRCNTTLIGPKDSVDVGRGWPPPGISRHPGGKAIAEVFYEGKNRKSGDGVRIFGFLPRVFDNLKEAAEAQAEAARKLEAAGPAQAEQEAARLGLQKDYPIEPLSDCENRDGSDV